MNAHSSDSSVDAVASPPLNPLQAADIEISISDLASSPHVSPIKPQRMVSIVSSPPKMPDTAPSAPVSKIVKKRTKSTLKTISKEHPEFELTYDMMLGIRTVIGQLSKPGVQFKEKLDPLDFTEESTLRMPQEGSNLTPAHRMRDFKFKDYAPKVFQHLRRRFNQDPLDYMMCVCGNFDYLEFISNAKSGQFFFYTHDRQFMIKTQTKAESKYMRSLLPQYYKHVMENPNTLITRFYGMHRVKPHKSDEKHFIIMGSVFHTPLFVHEVFDLKGSSQGRSATEAEKKQACPVLKDNDWTERKMHLKLGKEGSQLFMDQLKRDTKLLTDLNIMDYSLLLGIHYRDRPIPAELQEDYEDDKPEIETSVKPDLKRRQSNYGLKEGRGAVTPSQLQHLQSVFATVPEADTVESIAAQDIDESPVAAVAADALSAGGVCSYFCRENGGFGSSDDQSVYFAGIIDILQEWDSIKKAENFFKGLRYDPMTISAVAPDLYAARMQNFFSKSIE